MVGTVGYRLVVGCYGKWGEDWGNVVSDGGLSVDEQEIVDQFEKGYG